MSITFLIYIQTLELNSRAHICYKLRTILFYHALPQGIACKHIDKWEFTSKFKWLLLIVNCVFSPPQLNVRKEKKKPYLLLCSPTAKKNIGFGSDTQQQKALSLLQKKIMIWQDIFSREIGNNLENKH